MSDRRTEMALEVRDTVYRHIDGIAIGSTVAALDERGALKILATRERTSFAELDRELGANTGFLRVAARLLADQGWVTFGGDPGVETLMVEPTARGRVVFTQLAQAYRRAADFLAVAERIDEVLLGIDGEDALSDYVGLMRRGWDLVAKEVPGPARHQVLAHLSGHLVAPLMLAMTQRGMLRAGADLALGNCALGQAAGILAWQGWMQINGNTAWLTPRGELAVAYARQYRYPLVYLPLLRRVPELLFGDAAPMTTELPTADETHLDRALDVRFSGDVFTKTCRRPFLAMTLPLFDRPPLAEQPAIVVDTGCGDGAVLAALYTGVRSATARGRDLAGHPLLMVGVDPSPVARAIAASRLSAAGIPHLVLDGDIADPARLQRDLAARGLDATNALHICKSAIHDRAYRAPSAPAPTAPPMSYSAFVNPDGTDVPAAHIAQSLAELMSRWHPLTRRHGWVVIEAHAAPAPTAAGLIGRTLATTLDATHGYSCQYPVEPGVFAWAAGVAGFRSRAHDEPGAAQLGHTVLTIDHFVAGAAPAGDL